MGSLTTKMGLWKPASTDNVEEQTDINAPLDLLDQYLSLQNVTSGSRPASPWNGQLIFETDTTRMLVWSGSDWQILSDPPLCILKKTAPGASESQTPTINVVSWDAIVYNNDNMADLTNERIIVRRAGRYLVLGCISIDFTNNPVKSSGNIRKNGLVIAQETQHVTGTTGWTDHFTTAVTTAAVNDYFDYTHYYASAENCVVKQENAFFAALYLET